MSRNRVDGEVWFWLIVGAIGGSIGGLVGLLVGFGFWLGFIVGLMVVWGLPICGCIFD